MLRKYLLLHFIAIATASALVACSKTADSPQPQADTAALAPVAEAPPLTGQAAHTRPDRFVAPVLGPAHRLGVDLD